MTYAAVRTRPMPYRLLELLDQLQLQLGALIATVSAAVGRDFIVTVRQ